MLLHGLKEQRLLRLVPGVLPCSLAGDRHDVGTSQEGHERRRERASVPTVPPPVLGRFAAPSRQPQRRARHQDQKGPGGRSARDEVALSRRVWKW